MSIFPPGFLSDDRPVLSLLGLRHSAAMWPVFPQFQHLISFLSGDLVVLLVCGGLLLVVADWLGGFFNDQSVRPDWY
jgi:hypothetical protein